MEEMQRDGAEPDIVSYGVAVLAWSLLVCSAQSSRLRLLLPTRKPAHLPVRSFPGKLGRPI